MNSSESYWDLSVPDWRRLAAELVLHFHKTPGQASRICGCSIPAVQRCVAEYVHQQTIASAPSSGDSVFLPVILEEEPPPNGTDDQSSATPTSIPLEIVTADGLTLRLPLTSLDDIAHILHILETKPC